MDKLTGKYIKTTMDRRNVIEHGIQPAQMQFPPTARPASSQIKPPPAPKK